MLNKILRSPITTAVLFALAAVLLVTGTIGGVRAAPLITSDNFQASMSLQGIGAAVTENGAVSDGELLEALKEDFKIGKSYDEALAVTNTGAIDEYVRVTVYKYWSNAEGKAVDLDPAYIEVSFNSAWRIDEAASTEERTVLYYEAPLAPGATTPNFIDTLTVSPEVVTTITKGEAATSRDYENVSFHLEAVADAVQGHNAEEAMLSAWGK